MSVRRLEEVLPALAVHRVPASRDPVDWEFVERELGTKLPTDFVELSERYPSLAIAYFLSVHCVVPGSEAAFVGGVREGLEWIDIFRRNGGSHGYVPYPEPGGLLEWGDSNEGDVFFWRTDDAGPAAWTVVVAGRNDDWVEYPGGLTDYLAGLVTGEVPPDGLPPDFPGRTPFIESDE